MIRTSFLADSGCLQQRSSSVCDAVRAAGYSRRFRFALLIGVTRALLGLVSATPTLASDWIPTGELNAARAGHTATRLRDGRVLVAGGASEQDVLQTSELYDPQTGIWHPAATLNAGRYYHRAVMLTDGRVLVMGGWTAQFLLQWTASSEVYDPATDHWTQVRDLNHARRSHTATVLQDGRVLVAGGASTDGLTGEYPVASAEIFDPDTTTWTLTGELGSGRRDHTATLLADGRVVVSGGLVDSPLDVHEVLTSAEIYDPVTGEWKPTDELSIARGQHTATRLLDGSVLAAGGGSTALALVTGPTAPAEIFAPATETWSLTGWMTSGRSAHTTTLLGDGTALAVGGRKLGGEVLGIESLASTEIYDPESGNWALDADLGTARYDHTATLLADGRVLVTGGMLSTLGTFGGEALASAELHPGTDDPLSVSLILSATSFGPRDTLNVALEAFSAEQGFVTDVYFCALMPDGQSLAFIVDTAAPAFVVTRLDADARSFPALYENLRIPLGFAYRDESFFSYTFPDGLPEGNYTLFLALIPPGALDDGLLNSSDLLELESQNFAYQP